MTDDQSFKKRLLEHWNETINITKLQLEKVPSVNFIFLNVKNNIEISTFTTVFRKEFQMFVLFPMFTKAKKICKNTYFTFKHIYQK